MIFLFKSVTYLKDNSWKMKPTGMDCTIGQSGSTSILSKIEFKGTFAIFLAPQKEKKIIHSLRSVC